MLHLIVMSPKSPFIWNSSSLTFMTLTISQIADQLFYRIPFSLNLLMVPHDYIQVMHL